MPELEQACVSEAGVIADLASKAAKPQYLVHTPTAKAVAIGGGIETVELPEHGGDLNLRSIADVVAVCASDVWSGEPTVFVDAGCVRVVLDKSDRRRIAVMPLTISPQWSAAQALFERPICAAPEDLVQDLRFRFSDCGDEIQHLVSVLRDVRFESSSTRESKTVHGGNTMGRSLNAKVDKADQIPEEITLSIQPFTVPGLDFRVRVHVGVTPKPIEQRVELRAFAGSIERAEAAAVDSAVDALVQRLDKPETEGVLVLGGDPRNL